ncbi:hypothetical protein EBT31_06080 [bacterium]|nr:hypothetical protein [bacterium]
MVEITHISTSSTMRAVFEEQDLGMHRTRIELSTHQSWGLHEQQIQSLPGPILVRGLRAAALVPPGWYGRPDRPIYLDAFEGDLPTCTSSMLQKMMASQRVFTYSPDAAKRLIDLRVLRVTQMTSPVSAPVPGMQKEPNTIGYIQLDSGGAAFLRTGQIVSALASVRAGAPTVLSNVRGRGLTVLPPEEILQRSSVVILPMTAVDDLGAAQAVAYASRYRCGVVTPRRAAMAVMTLPNGIALYDANDKQTNPLLRAMRMLKDGYDVYAPSDEQRMRALESMVRGLSK